MGTLSDGGAGRGRSGSAKSPICCSWVPVAVAGVGGLAIFLSFCASVSVSGNLRSPFGSTWWWGGLKGDPSVSQWPEPVCVLHWKEFQTSQCLRLSSQGGALLPRFPQTVHVGKTLGENRGCKVNLVILSLSTAEIFPLCFFCFFFFPFFFESYRTKPEAPAQNHCVFRRSVSPNPRVRAVFASTLKAYVPFGERWALHIRSWTR